MKKVCHVTIGTVGHVDPGKATLTAAIMAVADHNMIVAQHMPGEPYTLSAGWHDHCYATLWDLPYEEVKGTPPTGRSQAQHNLIMNLNKKGRKR